MQFFMELFLSNNYCRCIEVTGAYGSQKTDINISLTAIGLLWTATDFIAKGLGQKTAKGSSKETEIGKLGFHFF